MIASAVGLVVVYDDERLAGALLGLGVCLRIVLEAGGNGTRGAPAAGDAGARSFVALVKERQDVDHTTGLFNNGSFGQRLRCIVVTATLRENVGPDSSDEPGCRV